MGKTTTDYAGRDKRRPYRFSLPGNDWRHLICYLNEGTTGDPDSGSPVPVHSVHEPTWNRWAVLPIEVCPLSIGPVDPGELVELEEWPARYAEPELEPVLHLVPSSLRPYKQQLFRK